MAVGHFVKTSNFILLKSPGIVDGMNALFEYNGFMLEGKE